ncbi:unnamed protein product [Caenorhabditis sp. 36 PRJEB53466]|nr:unnamed protein product [Caenorhabditis sp. 36 PRJEB53466]
MQFWHLLLFVVLFFGSVLAADLEGSGSGETTPTQQEPLAVLLKTEALLSESQSLDGSGAEASGEDVQTFFFF